MPRWSSRLAYRWVFLKSVFATCSGSKTFELLTQRETIVAGYSARPGPANFSGFGNSTLRQKSTKILLYNETSR